MGKRGGGGELGWMKFSRIVIERRRIDVPRARGEKIGNQRVLEYCQRCKIDCIFVEIFSFSPERTRLETRWNFLRRMPPRRNCRSVLENRSKFRRGSSETMQLVNVIVVYIRRGTSLENYPWILSSNKRSRRCDGPLRSLTFPSTFRFLLTVSSSLFQQFKSLASIFQRVKEKRFLINRNFGTR